MSFWELSRWTGVLGPFVIVGLFVLTIGKHLSRKTKLTHLVLVYVVWVFLGVVTLPFLDYFVEHSDALPLLWLLVGLLLPLTYCFITGIVMALSKQTAVRPSDLASVNRETTKSWRQLHPTVIAAIIQAIASVMVALLSKIL